MAVRGLILALALFSSLAAVLCADVGTTFKDINVTISITADPAKADLQAGEGKITVTWELNATNIDTSKYGKVALSLCYRKESQTDRPWRKSSLELFKDKTCQHKIGSKPYAASNNSIEYVVKKDVPSAHYFIRAFVLNAEGTKIAYGENKAIDLSITAITGRHASIDIAAAIFSGFSVFSLAFFFYLEKKKSKAIA